MIANERVPYPDALAKYAAAFRRMFRSSVTRFSSLPSRRIPSSLLASRLASAPLARPCFLIHSYRLVGRHPEPFGHLFNRLALLRHLPNRFPLELVRVSLLSPINTPESCLILGFQKWLRNPGHSTCPGSVKAVGELRVIP